MDRDTRLCSSERLEAQRSAQCVGVSGGSDDMGSIHGDILAIALV